MSTLNFRFEYCGKPQRLYYVEDNGDRERPIMQCFSREATATEKALWSELLIAGVETEHCKLHEQPEYRGEPKAIEPPTAATFTESAEPSRPLNRKERRAMEKTNV